MQRISYTVLLILITLASCLGGGQYSEMRQRLDALNALNRADSVLTVKERDEAQTLTDYFDSHGTPNDQMLAHYLLGRCYADMHEAPMAVDCYLDAIICADTTDIDCDYHTLGCIYSQISDIYHRQLLLSEEIVARRQASHYALLDSDTLNYIYENKLISGILIILGRKDSAEYLLKQVIQKYKEIDETQEMLQASTILMYLYAENTKNLDKLKELLDAYDLESNRFDKHHELSSTNKIFYYYKGKYYEGSNCLDSAEFYYRKVFYKGMSPVQGNSMYKGLLSVYQKRHQADSIAKYAKLYCEFNDSSIAIKDRELTAQMAASYNYNRYQKEAYENEQRAHSKQITLIIVIVITVALFLSVFYLFHKRVKNHRLRLAGLEREYQDKILSLQQLGHTHQQVLKILQDELDAYEHRSEKYKVLYDKAQQEIADYEQQKSELVKEIDQLNHLIGTIKKRQSVSTDIKNSQQFTETDVYQRFKYISAHPLEHIKEEDWTALSKAFNNHFPELFHDMVRLFDKNTTLRSRVCMLTALNFSNSIQACMLNTSKQNISNTMAALNKALFGEATATTFHDNLTIHYKVFIQ